MATFTDVNTALSPPEAVRLGEEQTPTTPTPNSHFTVQALPSESLPTNEESTLETPTRDSFSGANVQTVIPDGHSIPPQRREAQDDSQTSLKRNSLHQSADSEPSPEKQDVDMGDAGDAGDDDLAAEDDGSDDESVTSDSQRPSKKKKGQRFFCTNFPPCQLSFTRSEHLARHIRYIRRDV